jgi:hypothetical protein
MQLVELLLSGNHSHLAGVDIGCADVMNIMVAFLTYHMEFQEHLQAHVLVLETMLFAVDTVP